MIEGARAHPAYEVAVVGHRGFLGGAITRHLAGLGIAVRGFGRDDALVGGGAPHPDLASVSTIVWCAGRANPWLAQEQPGLADADIADLAAALGALGAQPPRVILLSSGGTVYGPPATPPFRESDHPAPINAYGAAKLAQETLLAQWPGPSVALRVANAYGPGQVAAAGQGVLAHWMTAVRKGAPIALFGDPRSTRDYVYVGDIAQAVAAVHGWRGTLPGVLNIGSGIPTTLDHLLDALREAVSPHEVTVHREAARSTDASHSVLDVSLAREVLDWRPRTPLLDGIRSQWLEVTS